MRGSFYAHVPLWYYFLMSPFRFFLVSFFCLVVFSSVQAAEGDPTPPRNMFIPQLRPDAMQRWYDQQRALYMPPTIRSANSLAGLPLFADPRQFPSLPVGARIDCFDMTCSSGHLVIGNTYIRFDNTQAGSRYTDALGVAATLPEVNRAVGLMGVPRPPGPLQIRPTITPPSATGPTYSQASFWLANPVNPLVPDTILLNSPLPNASMFLGHENAHRYLRHNPFDPAMTRNCGLPSFSACEIMPFVMETALGYHTLPQDAVELAVSMDNSGDTPAERDQFFRNWFATYLTYRDGYVHNVYAFTQLLVDEMYTRLAAEGFSRNQIPAEIQRRLTASALATTPEGVSVALGFRGAAGTAAFDALSGALLDRLEMWRTDPAYASFENRVSALNSQLTQQLPDLLRRTEVMAPLPPSSPITPLPSTGTNAPSPMTPLPSTPTAPTRPVTAPTPTLTLPAPPRPVPTRPTRPALPRPTRPPLRLP